MTTPAGTVSELAALVMLLRDHPESRDEAKQAFRRFSASLADGNHVLRLTPTGFMFDRTELPPGRGEFTPLYDHLRAHGIGEIRFPVGVMTSTLLSLLRIIAAAPGTYGSFDHLAARLDAAGTGVIPVLPLPEDLRSYRPAGSPAPPGPAPTPPGKVDDEGHIGAIGADALTEAKVGMMHFASLQSESLGPSDELIQRVTRATTESEVNEALNKLVAAGEVAVGQAEWGELLKLAHALIQMESRGGRPGEQRSFSIALRRMLPRSVLEKVVRLTARGQYKAEAVSVLKRMGVDSTEALLAALTESEDAAERRAYLSALKEMTEGGQLLVHMLTHDQWYVVRNVADLCGELRLESAVSALAKQVGHDDERVRRAVAGALAKIGTGGVQEPLRRALHDPSPAVRMQAAMDLDGRKARSMSAILAVAAEEEDKPDVQREMFLALGRIGSHDAIQVLSRAAEPGGKLFRRKPRHVRLAAIEGLHAAGPSGVNALKALLEDGEKEIREAVQKALQTLWA